MRTPVKRYTYRLPAAVVMTALLLAGCATLQPPPPAMTGDPEAAWAAVLRQRVDERGRVDFAGLARAAGCEATEDLEGVRDWLERRDGPLVFDARVDPDICAEWLEEAFRGH